jgi:two-component system, sensor histidine kinase and response regulator
VIGMTEMLLGTDLTPQQREYAHTAVSSGEALLGVINDILDFSKIEAGRLELDHHEFDLREAIEETCEMLAPQAHGKGLELLAWIDDDVPARVTGDRGRVRQVLINLLSNAVKFTPEGGRVGVEVGSDGAMAVLNVSDTGIGIPEGDQKELFNRFFRATNAVDRSIPGTGLGLAIVRTIVANHGGDLDVRSREGDGTSVTVRIPLLAPGTSRRAAQVPVVGGGRPA